MAQHTCVGGIAWLPMRRLLCVAAVCCGVRTCVCVYRFIDVCGTVVFVRTMCLCVWLCLSRITAEDSTPAERRTHTHTHKQADAQSCILAFMCHLYAFVAEQHVLCVLCTCVIAGYMLVTICTCLHIHFARITMVCSPSYTIGSHRYMRICRYSDMHEHERGSDVYVLCCCYCYL